MGQQQQQSNQQIGGYDPLQILLDPYIGLTEEEKKQLRKKARKDAMLQTGIGIMSQGYSHMPQTATSMFAPHLGQGMGAYEDALGQRSLQMRMAGQIGKNANTPVQAPPPSLAAPVPPQQAYGAPGSMQQQPQQQGLVAGAGQAPQISSWEDLMDAILPDYLKKQTQPWSP